MGINEDRELERMNFIRNKPLVIDKETGEPKSLMWVQTVEIPWLMVITRAIDLKRVGRKFASYKEATAFRNKWLEQHQDDEVTIVSRVVGYGPPYSKVSPKMLMERNLRGEYWCPYCRTFREFDWDPRWAIHRCPYCRTRITDYHVMKNNPRLQERGE